jgi:hypothetical protein
MKLARIAALTLCFQLVLSYAPIMRAQEPAAPPAPQAAGRGRGPIPVDPRVQISGSMPDIFAFFAKHSKPASR